jgi:hypothetical protein
MTARTRLLLIFVISSIENIRVREGDVVVLESPSGARGPPPIYCAFLVNQERMFDLRSPDFSSEDGTFEVMQKGNEIYFNLGFDKQRKKTAI